ncbi:hypothetical protein NKG94_17735 [Micromonospora sp. M12]
MITGGRVLRDRLRDLQNAARTEVLWFCRANPSPWPARRTSRSSTHWPAGELPGHLRT